MASKYDSAKKEWMIFEFGSKILLDSSPSSPEKHNEVKSSSLSHMSCLILVIFFNVLQRLAKPSCRPADKPDYKLYALNYESKQLMWFLPSYTVNLSDAI